MRNDDRMIAADSSIVSGEGVWKGGRRGSEDRKLLGEPKLPPQIGACYFFIVIEGLLFLLFGPSRLVVAYRVLPREGSQ